MALFVFKISSFKKSTPEDSHDLATGIVISIVLLPIIIVTIFMIGKNFAESNKKYQTLQNGQYVVVAKYNGSYILKKSSIKNDNLIIHNSHQKILDANNIGVITMTFDKVEIIND